MRSSGRLDALVGVLLVAVLLPSIASAQGIKQNYTQALAREAILRKDLDTQNGGSSPLLLRRVRALVDEYERMARLNPRSGYSDNALNQAARLAADAYWQFGEEGDRKDALRLFELLRSRFPTSSLIREVAPQTRRLEAAAKPKPAPAPAPAPVVDDRPLLKAIRRELLPDALRITLELEREATFHDERLDGPPRVFVDLQNTRAATDLRGATLAYTDDVVRQIRVGRQQNATRVVLDLQDAARHSVYALYNPYRVVIDFERPPAASAATAPAAVTAAPGSTTAAAEQPKADTPNPEPVKTEQPKATERSEAAAVAKGPNAEEPGATWTEGPASAAAAPPPTPTAPAANLRGRFSLSRQLGLGISRVVIDAGHGGHDPGAHIKGLTEASLTLDVALRLEKLLLTVPGVEVVMTRRTNVYIPLAERTAIANRAGADLFLSIHVNASPNPRARGIETYFLNFAPNPEAEAIAARENAGSSKTMHNLPDIVKAIALNNKIDESRDFASLVQSAMFDGLKKRNANARNLGVKQAPFMVLIGATMPSILAEISFITNRQEASLLRTANYRQAIADALFAGISKYQRSLKAAQTAAAQY